MDINKINIDEAYDSPPIWYDIRGLFILWFSYRSSLIKQIKFFSYFKPDSSHLEVAIGSGSLFQIIYYWIKITSRLPNRIVGFDYAPAMLEGARKKFEGNKKIELIVADATNLPFRDESFDTINVSNSLHCIPNYQKAIQEAARVLKPKGVMSLNALIIPEGRLQSIALKINQWGIKKGILQRAFEVHEVLKSLELASFEVVEKFKDGNCLYVRAQKK
jgi:ubiquinone/menaquinone biosynthesis C-methylase UbiE